MTNPAAAMHFCCWPRATNHAHRRGIAGNSSEVEAPPFPKREARAKPGGGLANSLEFPPAAFHYSVIGPLEVGGRRGDKTFNSVRTASSPRKAVPLQMHKEMIDGSSTTACQFRFRTGDRKINANGFETGGRDNGQTHVHSGLLMRLVKNIHATLPSYATIVPILHAQHVTPAQRGITHSIGAADATGR